MRPGGRVRTWLRQTGPENNVFPERRLRLWKTLRREDGLEVEPRGRGWTDALISQQERRRGAPRLLESRLRAPAGEAEKMAAACFSGHAADCLILDTREDQKTPESRGVFVSLRHLPPFK